jgi:hypothetical protein
VVALLVGTLATNVMAMSLVMFVKKDIILVNTTSASHAFLIVKTVQLKILEELAWIVKLVIIMIQMTIAFHVMIIVIFVKILQVIVSTVHLDGPKMKMVNVLTAQILAEVVTTMVVVQNVLKDIR